MTPLEEQTLLIKANNNRTPKLPIAQIGSKVLETLYSSEGRRKSLIEAAAFLIHQAELEDE